MLSSTRFTSALFYEVYVRAFYDSNGDGHGDLQGLTQKLDYLQDLGVNCLWLLPIYPSPLKDDGYDLADFYDILPEYGTLDDLKNLIESAHARGMRVITDLVLNHTSDQHPWFQAARAMFGATLIKNIRAPGSYFWILSALIGPGMKLPGSITGTASIHPSQT